MTGPGRSGAVGPRWSLWLRTAVRLLLAAVFVVAGANKVLDLDSSVASVAAYRLLPGQGAAVVGVVLPFAEIVLGLVLASGLVTRVAAVVAGSSFLVFTVAVISVAARGIAIDCGCFGGGGPVAPGQTGYPVEVVRDVLLLVAAVWLVVRPSTRLSLAGGLHRPDDPSLPDPNLPDPNLPDPNLPDPGAAEPDAGSEVGSGAPTGSRTGISSGT